MTKDTAKNIGLAINLFIVFLFAFADDYLFKTLNLEYFKFEYQDSFLWNITHLRPPESKRYYQIYKDLL